jgi:hypothetical protein
MSVSAYALILHKSLVGELGLALLGKSRHSFLAIRLKERRSKSRTMILFGNKKITVANEA